MTEVREIPLTKGYVTLVDAADYDRVSGVRWYAENRRPGLVYARRRIWIVGEGRCRSESLHGVLTGWPLVDHINGNGLDNRRANLRPATVAQNGHNTGPYRTNTSGFKGVCRSGSKWLAQIQVRGVHRRLGRFSTPEEAARAYDAAARELMGDFAYVNFPESA